MKSDYLLQVRSHNDGEGSMSGQFDTTVMRKGKRVSSVSDKNNNKSEVAARKQKQKEEKAHILEERKRKRQVRLTPDHCTMNDDIIM